MGCTHATPVLINGAISDIPVAKSERTLRKTSSIDINDEKPISPPLDVQKILNTSSKVSNQKNYRDDEPNDNQELIVVTSVISGSSKTNPAYTINAKSAETLADELKNKNPQIADTDTSITPANNATSDYTTLNIYPLYTLRQSSKSSLARIFQPTPASETENENENIEYAEPVNSYDSMDTPVYIENSRIPQDDGPLTEEYPEIDQSFASGPNELISAKGPTSESSDNKAAVGARNIMNLNSSVDSEQNDEQAVIESTLVNSKDSYEVELIILPDVCIE